jgi:hypothetical protein
VGGQGLGSQRAQLYRDLETLLSEGKFKERELEAARTAAAGPSTLKRLGPREGGLKPSLSDDRYQYSCREEDNSCNSDEPNSGHFH